MRQIQTEARVHVGIVSFRVELESGHLVVSLHDLLLDTLVVVRLCRVADWDLLTWISYFQPVSCVLLEEPGLFSLS